MVEKRLVEYLKTYKAQGYNDDQLRQHLTKVGWDPKVLDDAFREMKQPQPTMPQFTRPAPIVQRKPEPVQQKPAETKSELGHLVHKESYHRASHVTPIIAIAVVLLLIGLFFYFYTAMLVHDTNKPYIAKPNRPIVGAAVDATQVQYLLNEAGAYNLHNNPLPGK